MRLMVKGGVWNNTEDEILKASVMKYGKNQWSRISYLLSRKSSKQLKARWSEWLDPSVKKTEWTRQEDEKLLHLAKLMPSQWKTIAPIVGRTSAQCIDRYERLVDAACGRDDGSYEAGDDPRKLRPGEIDPNAESRPARPDPVDMDEDEIEMLSEARARLANTRGKKAKRKAREKQFEEARRLADLQKRRELKAAGIDNGHHRKRKIKGIDYNAEIPFEKKPPLGFYDVTDERQTADQSKFPTTVDELEGEKRCDKEAHLRRRDAARNSILQRQDAPSAMLQANKPNDQEATRKRTKLNLPTPQIPDRELEPTTPSVAPSPLVAGLTSRVGITLSRDGPSFGMTPKGTPIRDELHINDDMDMIAKTELRRQADVRRNLLSGLTSLPQPKNEYQIMVQSIPEDDEEPEENLEEDMSDRIAREKAEDEGNCSFVPRTVIEQADMMVRQEVLSLLEHDNLKYPTGENIQKKENVTALQDEIGIVRRRMDDDTKKAHKFEQKIKLLTSGYQHRGRNLWSQIEATLKLVDDAEIELKCFQALHNEEQLSASRRINALWNEVQKQKELQQTLQKRYEYVLSAQARVQEV